MCSELGAYGRVESCGSRCGLADLGSCPGTEQGRVTGGPSFSAYPAR